MKMDKTMALDLLTKLKAVRTEGYLLMPTISTDIETAGVDKDKDTLISFAAVFDNGKYETQVTDMPFVKYKVWHNSICGNPYAIAKMPMNLKVIQEMADLKESDVLKMCCVVDEKGNVVKDEKGIPVANKLADYRDGWVTVDVFAQLLNEYFSECKKEFDVFYDARNERHQGVTFQGKNFANFDLPFIRRTLLMANNDKMNKFLNNGIKHRILDVGSAWVDSFTFMPSLDDINKVMGRKEVSHDAIDDVLDCIASVRMKMEYQRFLEDNLLKS
jgi:hypothetical protein